MYALLRIYTEETFLYKNLNIYILFYNYLNIVKMVPLISILTPLLFYVVFTWKNHKKLKRNLYYSI